MPYTRMAETAARLAGCTLGDARTANCRDIGACSHCGWSKAEAERRRAIPLTPDAQGLARKAVGSGARADG